MGKRVVLATFGSLGDLHPFIAVAKALQQRGAEPVLAGAGLYREKVKTEGIAFREVRPSEKMLADAGLTVADFGTLIGKSPYSLIDRAIAPYLNETYEDLCGIMQGADLSVTSSFAFAARIAAEKLGVRTATLLLSPLAFFSAEDPPHLFDLPWLPRFRQLFGARATRAVIDMGRLQSRRLTRKISDFRRRVNVPMPAGDEVIDGPLRADRIFALYSPLLGPLPADAPRQSSIAGFAFYDGEAGEATALAPDLEEFLSYGPPPVVFTLGSSGVHSAGRFYEEAAKATRALRKRALLLVGADADAKSKRLASEDMFIAGYAPHSQVFPRASAIVHHGGIGTVGQAMRAGKAQLICPMFADQRDNAERLSRLGIGTRLDHRRFTAERAAAVIDRLLGDFGVASRAAAIAASVTEEDGAGFVADQIAAMLHAA
jgi:UDP:flavonoid glycosyltransferase YjiC (YdhE family)